MLTPDSDAYPVLTLVDGGPAQSVGRNHGLPDGKRLSRQHCQFWRADGVIFMQDGSSCGTWLNGSRVEKAQPVTLRPGDVVSFPVGVDVASPTYKCSAAKSAAGGKQRAESSAAAAPKRQRAGAKGKAPAAPAPAPALDRRQLAALAAERRAEAEASRRAEAAAEAKAKAEAEAGAQAKAREEAARKAAEVRAAAARLAAATKAKVEAKAKMAAEEAEEAEEAAARPWGLRRPVRAQRPPACPRARPGSTC